MRNDDYPGGRLEREIIECIEDFYADGTEGEAFADQIAGALITVACEIIAGQDDRRARAEIVRDIAKTLPEVVAKFRKEGRYPGGERHFLSAEQEAADDAEEPAAAYKRITFSEDDGLENDGTIEKAKVIH